MKKRLLSLLLIVCLMGSLAVGCGQKAPAEPEPAAPVEEVPEAPAAPVEEPEEEPAEAPEEAPEEIPEEPAPATREFTDSVGRTLTVPAEITRIALTGPLTQIYVMPLAGDLLVGVPSDTIENGRDYLPAYLYDLPKLGQLYGGKGEMDLEALLAAAPDVVIDVGEAKKSIKEDLDGLTEQTGIPFIHIDATVYTAPDCYRALGDLLNRPEKAEELAQWCGKILAQTNDLMAQVDSDGVRKNLLYCVGPEGLNVIAEGSFHAETINTMSNNVAVVENVVGKGTGNEVDLEQIMVWDPEVIIFAPDSIYDTVAEKPEWQSVTAIAEGNYYKTPGLPFGWLSSPPSVQRYLGLLWLGSLLYPEYADYDLQALVTEYYDLFYDCDLTDEMYQELMVGAMPQ